MFAYLDSRGPVDVAFTDRHGGVSTGPFASLNLAHGGADQAASVAENLRLVAAGLAAETGGQVPAIALMRQVHGAQVAVVDEPAVSAADAPECDGLVTRLPGIALTVRVADCVPVLLADLDAGVVGAAHAGRPGLVAGIVPATVARMRSEGATRLRAWVGPHVCGRCYEVPADMRDDVAGVVPESFAETSWGTPALDVGAGVHAQLAAADVEVVHATARCTLEHDDLYSYRRDGAQSGRLAGLVRIRA